MSFFFVKIVREKKMVISYPKQRTALNSQAGRAAQDNTAYGVLHFLKFHDLSIFMHLKININSWNF